MAFNFSSDAAKAILALRGNPHFDAFRADLHRLIVKNSIEVGSLPDPTALISRGGYIRCLHEMWRAIEAITRDMREAQVDVLDKKLLAANTAFDDDLLDDTPLDVPPAKPDMAAALRTPPAPKK